jgi:DNA-binding MarR family transcriptional regulator
MGTATQLDLAVTVQTLFGALRRLSPPGLSLTAASTLSTLERQGPRRLTELAVKEGVTQPAMTQLVSRLERDSLVARVGDPHDGRAVLVEITQAGRDLLHHRRSTRTRQLNAVLRTMPADDRRAIEGALPALNRLAELI